jgi:MscS family membrane protein
MHFPVRRLLAASAFGAALAAAGPVAGQMPGISPTIPAPAAEAPGDPYRRETPYGAFFGYMRAASRQNWVLAAEYLQWPKNAKSTPEEIAKQLKAVLDERFAGDLEKVSRSPLGDLNDGLSPELERVGAIERGDDSFDVLVVRTQPVDGPAVWLVSSQTLREIPATFRELTTPGLDRLMPVILQRQVAGALRLWQVLAFWALIPVAWLLARLLAAVLLGGARRAFARRSFAEGLAGGLDSFRGPLALLAAVPLHAFAVTKIGLPLLGRYNYGRFSRLVVIAALAWLLIRVLRFLTSRATMRLLASGEAAASSLTIGRRVLQGTVVFLALLAGLASLGVNLTATLAGLGIGGVALAFAAQKSLENLFGGFVVLSDRILRVGDTVRIGTAIGEIEDVTLYATRLRAFDRSVVTIPNGSLITAQIENQSRRDKFWFHPTLGLVYETTAEQMRAVLENLRARLASDPRVEKGTMRVRFVRLASSSLDVEVSAYLLVPDYTTFLAVQEELLLLLLDVIEKAGTCLAFPSQTTYAAGESAAPLAARPIRPSPAP